MRTTNEKPISPTLKAMKRDETTSFKLAQSQSVRSTIQALKTEMCELNIDFTTKKNKETKMLEVTRTN